MANSYAKVEKDAISMAGKLWVDNCTKVSLNDVGFFKRFNIFKMQRNAKKAIGLSTAEYNGSNQMEIVGELCFAITSYCHELEKYTGSSPLERAIFNIESKAKKSNVHTASKQEKLVLDVNHERQIGDEKQTSPMVSTISKEMLDKLKEEMKQNKATEATQTKGTGSQSQEEKQE